MKFLKKTVRIFIKQVQTILSKDARLTQLQLHEKKVEEDKIELSIETHRNNKLIKQKAKGIANLRFKHRRIANVDVKEDTVTINFIPEE